jgi:YrbI family 3-deoxy-D-manno-octulosonate 8-phosphate phosphatase
VIEKIKKISTVITDIDGVWTDGGMYYDETGNEFKKFNTRDGMGVERLRNFGIETVIFTSEDTNIVRKRAKKLHIKNCFVGVKDKKKLLKLFCQKNKIDINAIAYIGDDLNDFGAMEIAGFTACPNDAFKDILESVDYICKTNGGMGVFREFAELIMEKQNESN